MTTAQLTAIKPGTPMSWHDWVLRELILRPEKFCTPTEARQSMAEHRAEKQKGGRK